MLQRVIEKLASSLFALFAVSFVVFLLVHLIPGDPVEVMLGEYAGAADRQALRQSLGLDQPVMLQLVDYYRGLLEFDLGNSLFNNQPVAGIILQRLPATVELGLAGLFVSIIIAFPLGVLAAYKRGQAWDYIAGSVSLFGLSIPNFVLGPVLMLVFALWFGLLPVSGRQGPESLILPAVTLGTALSAMLVRMLRSSLLEVLGEPYIRSAYARGLSPGRVLWRHAVRNAWLPVMTLLGLQLGALLAGTVITETVFSWPGIGQLLVESIQKRDYPLLQGCVLFISAVYVVVNTGVDILYAYIDPRIRVSQS